MIYKMHFIKYMLTDFECVHLNTIEKNPPPKTNKQTSYCFQLCKFALHDMIIIIKRYMPNHYASLYNQNIKINFTCT